MPKPASLEAVLLAGARELLAAHARELPQRDDLCGAFCGALALHAAGVGEREGRALDQDDVALAAGSVVSDSRDAHTLPAGETGRRDYRLRPPLVADAAVSGTTAAGLLEAIEQLADGALAAIPLAGPWSAESLDGVFDALAQIERPVSVLANIATRHLWGGRARSEQILGYLYEGSLAGPPADWDVGHFVSVFARIGGPAGSMYAIADTYPALGNAGVHVQPRELLASALERRDMPAGGMIVVVSAHDAEPVRASASALGLDERAWDNGSVSAETR